MSLIQTINYDTPGNFAFDSAKVQVTSVAALKLGNNAGQSYSQGFASDSGFTYDDTKAEFAGGLLRQLPQRPAGATFGARFDAFVDANWGDGTLTAVQTGSPQIFEGKMQLTGGGRFVSYDAAGNAAPNAMAGCVRLRITPNYNDTPSQNQTFFDLYNSDSSGKNRISLFHATNGSFFILMNDADGVNVISNSVGAFMAVAGTELEIELSWDLVEQKVRFFGEGYMVAELDATFTRDTNVDTIALGDASADFSIRDVVIFNVKQHTATYTPHEYTLPAGDFVESATLPTFAYAGPGAVQAYTSFAATVAGATRFILNGRYWNGSAWVASDGTYAEAATYAAAVANIAMVPATSSLVARVVFPDGNTQGSIDVLTLTYTGQIYPTDDPPIIHASAIAADDLLGFAATLSASGSDGVKFQIAVDGVNKWWNGAAWETSDGTYAQANTPADIETNKGDLDISDGVLVRVRAVLHSATGATTPTLTSVAVAYDFFAAVPDPPTECIVYGFACDILGELLATAPVLVVTLTRQFSYNDEFIVMPFTSEVEADNDGRFEVSLVETESAEKTYRFNIRYTDVATNKVKTLKLGNAQVPNSPSVNLAALTFT